MNVEKGARVALEILLAGALAAAPLAAAAAPSEPAAEPAALAAVDTKPLSAAEKKSAAEIVSSFLDAAVRGDQSHEKYLAPEVADADLRNNYMIDRHMISKYKRSVEVTPDGEAIATYDGDGETVRQEFGVARSPEGGLKISSISEKRYQKLNAARRACYLGTRAAYKLASLLPAISPDMQTPQDVSWKTLRDRGLVKSEPRCPSGGTITLSVVKGVDTQNPEALPCCSIHGDFFELYKLDERVPRDFDAYNRDIDREEAPLLSAMAGDTYAKFQRLQPIEARFYGAFEKKDTAAMKGALDEAQKIEQRLGNMYITMIRAYRGAKDEKSAQAVFAAASKVYPGWAALRDSLTEKHDPADDGDDLHFE